MRTIRQIVIHQSDSAFGNATQIDAWHKERGWSGIGYHRVILNGCVRPGIYVLRNDGLIQEGRPLEKVGAHVAGHNAHTLAICLIGKGNGLPIALSSSAGTSGPLNGPPGYITAGQWTSLVALCRKWLKEFGLTPAAVLAHREFAGVHKTCPGFEVAALRAVL